MLVFSYHGKSAQEGLITIDCHHFIKLRGAKHFNTAETISYQMFL